MSGIMGVKKLYGSGSKALSVSVSVDEDGYLKVEIPKDKLLIGINIDFYSTQFARVCELQCSLITGSEDIEGRLNFTDCYIKYGDKTKNSFAPVAYSFSNNDNGYIVFDVGTTIDESKPITIIKCALCDIVGDWEA